MFDTSFLLFHIKIFFIFVSFVQASRNPAYHGTFHHCFLLFRLKVLATIDTGSFFIFFNKLYQAALPEHVSCHFRDIFHKISFLKPVACVFVRHVAKSRRYLLDCLLRLCIILKALIVSLSDAEILFYILLRDAHFLLIYFY